MMVGKSLHNQRIERKYLLEALSLLQGDITSQQFRIRMKNDLQVLGGGSVVNCGHGLMTFFM